MMVKSLVCVKKENEASFVSVFTQKVVYRFYLINRLQNNIAIIFSYFENYGDITNEFIRAVKNDWDDLRNYRRIAELDFELSLAKRVLALVEEIVGDEQQVVEIKNISVDSISKMPIDLNEILKNIDYCVDTLVGKVTSRSFLRMPVGKVTTDSISFRFYAIKRLSVAIGLFKKAYRLNVPFVPLTRSVVVTLSQLEQECTHPRVIQVITDMLYAKSLEPLVILLEEFQQYRYADDSPFLREMLAMLLTTYRDLLHSNKATMQEQVEITEKIEQILDLYEHIEELSTEEVLDCIDSTTDNLMVIIEKIEERDTWYNKIVGWAFSKR